MIQVQILNYFLTTESPNGRKISLYLSKYWKHGDPSVRVGEKLGYITKGLHFSPANKSGYEVCRWRSKGGTMACLDTAGRGQMNMIQDSRIAKTKLFFEK